MPASPKHATRRTVTRTPSSGDGPRPGLRPTRPNPQRTAQSGGSGGRSKLVILPIVFIGGLWWLGYIQSKFKSLLNDSIARLPAPLPAKSSDPIGASRAGGHVSSADLAWRLSGDFYNVLHRAEEKRDRCQSLDSQFRGFDTSTSVAFGHNETVASLPAFGIIDTIKNWKAPNNDIELAKHWQCAVPNRKECQETKFTVVFMAYNPERLADTFRAIESFLTDTKWQTLIEEVVLVWNGERHVNETATGQQMLDYERDHAFRFAYPLKMGLENDLMNRYHPDVVQVKTRAILYYDDDGPFYSFEAVQGGFELWKRHSSAQVGAMARELTYSQRQAAERKSLSEEPNDRLFVSHCDNLDDQVDYNFRYFANYDANMVLPSGSFLHSQYLCFLWHPVLEPIRQFVRAHPVHPDDMTVSLIVSQLASRAPRVYSRRLKPTDPQRRLTEEEEEIEAGLVPASEYEHRRLMFSINWDAGAGMTDQKKYWAALRTEAVNSLVRYFGSLNSGSIGWCEDTKYYDPSKDGRCEPIMARIGWLPWMEPDGSVKLICP